MHANQLPPVAKKVYHPCKKCECERYHVVIAHTTATVARLECEVCKSKSVLRLDEPKSRRATVPKKSSASARVAAHLSKWKELKEQAGERPVPYTMKGRFEVGTVVEHPKFGVGYVIVATGQAIQVVFEDAERSLVHNRT